MFHQQPTSNHKVAKSALIGPIVCQPLASWMKMSQLVLYSWMKRGCLVFHQQPTSQHKVAKSALIGPIVRHPLTSWMKMSQLLLYSWMKRRRLKLVMPRKFKSQLFYGLGLLIGSGGYLGQFNTNYIFSEMLKFSKKYYFFFFRKKI